MVAYSPATADVVTISNTTTAVAAQAILVPGRFTQFISTGVAMARVNLPA